MYFAVMGLEMFEMDGLKGVGRIREWRIIVVLTQ